MARVIGRSLKKIPGSRSGRLPKEIPLAVAIMNGGVSGHKDDGTECVTDCDEIFNPGDFVGCQGVDTIVYPAAETP